jgi:hypothetical protein
MALRRCLLLLAAALSVLLAGCGGSSSHSTPITRARLLSAIDQTRAIRSAHIVQSFSVVSPQGNFQGALSADANFASNAGTTIVEAGSVKEHAVFGNGTVWLTMNAPQFTRLLPSGKTWVRASTSELESLGAFHPLSNSFALLDGLRGVKTIRQSGANAATFTFSLAKAMAETPASRRAALQAAINANGDIQSETGSVALNPSGAVRSESLRVVGTGSNAGIRLETSLAISNVGEAVPSSPPPAAQVASLSSLPGLESALRSSASS